LESPTLDTAALPLFRVIAIAMDRFPRSRGYGIARGVSRKRTNAWVWRSSSRSPISQHRVTPSPTNRQVNSTSNRQRVYRKKPKKRGSAQARVRFLSGAWSPGRVPDGEQEARKSEYNSKELEEEGEDIEEFLASPVYVPSRRQSDGADSALAIRDDDPGLRTSVYTQEKDSGSTRNGNETSGSHLFSIETSCVGSRSASRHKWVEMRYGEKENKVEGQNSDDDDAEIDDDVVVDDDNDDEEEDDDDEKDDDDNDVDFDVHAHNACRDDVFSAVLDVQRDGDDNDNDLQVNDNVDEAQGDNCASIEDEEDDVMNNVHEEERMVDEDEQHFDGNEGGEEDEDDADLGIIGGHQDSDSDEESENNERTELDPACDTERYRRGNVPGSAIQTPLASADQDARNCALNRDPLHGFLDLSKMLAENQRDLCTRGLLRTRPLDRAVRDGSSLAPNRRGATSGVPRGAQTRQRPSKSLRGGYNRAEPQSLPSCNDTRSIDEEGDSAVQESIPETIQERWAAYIRFLPVDFCDHRNEEAALRGRKDRIRPGEISYRGLLLNHETNEDVNFIYTHMYESKALRGQSIASYEQLRACVGQYMRFAITSGRIPLERACEKGELFGAILHMDVIKTFLSYFQLRCSASTCLSKSFHLRTVSKYAERFFCSISVDGGRKARAALMTDFLTGSCAAEKFEARRGTARMRCEERRIASGKLLVGDDFRRFGKAAEQRLCTVIQSGPDALRRSRGLLSRWCIAFVGLLAFYGGGQRPQVYAQLQEPEDLDSSIRRWAKDKRVTLAALLEKRPRQTGFSKVSFPGHLIRFFDFHFRVVKPKVLEALGMMDRGPGDRRDCGADEDAENPVLLNTRTGLPYSAYQVRTTLHRFVQSVDPELTSVTPSSLRSSYATWQFQAYREGLIFEGLREDDFLDTLGKIMNTSPEQLKATYIACSAMDSNYDRIMAEVHELFQREDQDEQLL
jgi:hypothetical protein